MYEISKRIRKITDEKFIIKETILYSAFTRLLKKGYIIAYRGEETFGKKEHTIKLHQKGLIFYLEMKKNEKLLKKLLISF